MKQAICLYTIGFTQKSAEEFFTILKNHKVKRIIDVRLNNTSQLAAFAKGKDLAFFLKSILKCEYIHISELAPTKEILKNYKNKTISWNEYESAFLNILHSRSILDTIIQVDTLDKSCLLCSEPTPDQCHRRLVAEYLQKVNPDMEIIHL